ncbi:hypothetical protein OROGR_026946 [Orobanche gracilis]
MVDLAGSGGANYSEYLSLKTANRTAETARRRRRFLMRRRANGSREGVGARSKLAREEGGSIVVGYPISAPGNGDVLLGSMELESRGLGVPVEAGCLGAPNPEEAGRGNPVPVVGAIAVAGRLRYMEDAVCIKTNLCSPAINDFLPVHYFGVFDGHGGPHFSFMCKKKMHEILEGELMGVSVQPNQMWPSLLAAAVPPPPPPGTITDDESLLQEIWRKVMSRCFARMETVALHTCLCGSMGFLCGCVPAAVSFSGTTAVTVVLTEKHIVTANCGDSRAVLFRSGRIVPLSFDHKADRKDETARVEASGGRVINTDTPRVEGRAPQTSHHPAAKEAKTIQINPDENQDRIGVIEGRQTTRVEQKNMKPKHGK